MNHETIKLFVRIGLSLILLIAGLYVLIWNIGNDSIQKASIGWIGIIIGYWIR